MNMGMMKDTNNIIKEFTSIINTLQSSYRKHGVGHKLSRARNGVKSRNDMVASKIYGFTNKIIEWIKQEMKK